MTEDDTQGWGEVIQGRLREKAEKSIIRRLSVFLLKLGLIKETPNKAEIYRYRDNEIHKEVITLKILGYDTGVLHSYIGPAKTERASREGSVSNSCHYYVHGLECTKEEWQVKVKKHNISIIKKG